jgi:hypothetical protein
MAQAWQETGAVGETKMFNPVTLTDVNDQNSFTIYMPEELERRVGGGKLMWLLCRLGLDFLS